MFSFDLPNTTVKEKQKKKADTIIPYFTDKQNEAQKGYQIRIRLQS